MVACWDFRARISSPHQWSLSADFRKARQEARSHSSTNDHSQETKRRLGIHGSSGGSHREARQEGLEEPFLTSRQGEPPRPEEHAL